MASLLARLSKPVHDEAEAPAPAPAPAGVASTALARAGGSAAPPYGARQGFVPRKPSDFGDGGAYPECHVAQYPLDCGRKGAPGVARQSTVAVTVTEDGSVDYSSLVKQGANANKVVHTAHSALVPKLHDVTPEDLARPDQEVVDATLAATRAVIEARVNGTLAANQPKSLPALPGAPQYIKYTPARQGPEFNSGASHRIIKMHTVAVDPLEPPKFAHKKVPRGPGSPPVPVMHSPPRPVSKRDAADWKIPPCISNWKNAKGYTVPLDKRLAADGRGLTEVQINDGFAKLSEALYVAESKAREAVETRAKITRELLAKEKDRKEDELRSLAQAARLARGGVVAVGGAGGSSAPLPPPPPLPAGVARPRAMDYDGDEGERLPPPPPGGPPPGGYPPPPPMPARAAGGAGAGYGSDGDEGGAFAAEAPREDETPAEREARRRRDEIREERRRERERERRLEARDAHGGKRSKLTRDRDRDVSERMALGQANLGAAGRSAEQLYDQRLFNQDAGLDAGFGPDDGYNTFSKPLFADRGQSLYAPGRGGDAAADAEAYGGEAAAGEGEADPLASGRFKPDRGFAGAEQAQGKAAAGGRSAGPVAFERPPEDDDPFGLGAFMTDVRRGGGAPPPPPQGRPGAMAAAAGGGGDGAGSGRSRVDFQSGGR